MTAGKVASFTTPLWGHSFDGDVSFEITLTVSTRWGTTGELQTHFSRFSCLLVWLTTNAGSDNRLMPDTASSTVNVFPIMSEIDFFSSSGSGSVIIDGLSCATPFTLRSLVGFQHTVVVSLPASRVLANLAAKEGSVPTSCSPCWVMPVLPVGGQSRAMQGQLSRRLRRMGGRAGA